MSLTFLYLAVLIVLFVLLARRTDAAVDWKTAVLFYATILVVLFQPLVLDRAMLPMDYLDSIHPWRDDPAYIIQNPELNDLPLQIIPWAELVRRSWKSGEAPLWNNYAQAGYPLLANAQSQALSPWRLLALPLDLSQSLTLEAALKLLASLWFTWLVARRYRVPPAGAYLVAISWTLSSSIAVWINFPLATVLSLLPATWYGIELLFERVTWGRFLFLTGVFVMLLLGGHPESAAHIILLCGLWVLVRIALERRDAVKPVAAITGAGTTSLILALPVLLPFIEALPFTRRMAVLELGELHHPFFWKYLVNFVQPRFFGTLATRDAWGPAHAEVITGFAGILAVAGLLGSLLLVVRAPRLRMLSGFLLAAAILLGAVAIDVPFIAAGFDTLPLFSLAENSRLRFVFCWSGALLVGLLFRRAVEGDRLPLIAGSLGALVVLVSLYLGGLILTPDVVARSFARGWLSLPVATAAVIVSLIRITSIRLWLLSALVLIELAGFFYSWNPIVDSDAVYPSLPVIEELRTLLDEDELRPARMTGQYGTMFPNTSAIFGFEDIRGHDPMSSARVLGMLRVYTGYTSDRYFGILPDLEHPFIDFLNVRYVMTAPGGYLDPGSFELVYDGEDGRLYRNREALPRFFSPRHTVMVPDREERVQALLEHADWRNAVVLGRIHSSLIGTVHDDIFGPKPDETRETDVTIISASPRRYEVEVDAARWSVVVSSLPLFPGWRIWSQEGEEILVHEVNEGFIGFLAPPGVSRVTVVYRPLSFYRGLYASALALAILLAIPGYRAWRVRRDSAPVSA